MMTNKNKPLAKVFLPALLLTATLSLPVESMAAPSPNPRNAQSEKADKNEKRQKKQKQQKQEVRQDRREVRHDQREVKQDRREVRQQRDDNRQRAAELQRQAQARRDAERQRVAQQKATRVQKQRKVDYDRQARLQREAQLNRQAEINRQAQFQRQAELNRRAELQRQADLRRRADQQRYRNDDRYSRDRNGRYYRDNAGRYYRDSGGRYYDNNGRDYNDRYVGSRGRYNFGDSIAVDGHLTNEGYECQALRDDDGTLYMLVGNTYGLRTGDHARLVGRVVDGGHCDWEGTAFEVTDVRALWADRRHRSVYYHENLDGGIFGNRNNWTGRRARAFENRVEQRNGYYDRDQNRYNDRYRN